MSDVQVTIDLADFIEVTIDSDSQEVAFDPARTVILDEVKAIGFKGDKGDPGDPGMGSDTFVWDQGVAMPDWTIPHDLGKFPSVSVVDTMNREMMGTVEYVDDNTLIVHFNGGFSGVAYLN